MTKRRLDAQKILSKLETVLKTQDRQVIADSLEMKKKTLDKALSRGTISLLILENFCSKNHVSMDFFIRDDEAMQASGMVRVPVDRMNVNVLLFNDWKERPDVRLEDYYAAPLVEDRIAAGYGREIRDLGPDDFRNFVWIYAPALKDRRSHGLVAVEVDGESMMPTIYHGDIVLIDTDDPGKDTMSFESGRIYAIRTERHGGCAIKRVYAGKAEVRGSIPLISTIHESRTKGNSKVG